MPRVPAPQASRRFDDAPERPARRPHEKCVRIAQTPVGKGVFAGKRYPAEAIIGEILGDVIAEAGYASRYCMDIGDDCVLEPQPPFRYVNHSCRPNCRFDYFDLTPAGASEPQRCVFLIAVREIRPDEELTIDYNWPAGYAIVCRCGEPTCRGWIVDPRELSLLTTRAGEQERSEMSVG